MKNLEEKIMNKIRERSETALVNFRELMRSESEEEIIESKKINNKLISLQLELLDAAVCIEELISILCKKTKFE